MKTAIAVIKEALEIIRENPEDQEVINEQARLIIKYAKELIIKE